MSSLSRLAAGALIAVFLAAVAAAQPTNAIGVFRRVVFGGVCNMSSGSGTPEGSVTGSVCDVYLRTNGGSGSTLYVKETGTATNTGWTAIASGGGSSHSLLSSTHTDTTATAVTRGAVITGQGASPTWSKLAVGGLGTFLRSDSVDLAWSSDGSTLTSLNASNLGSGTVPTARLGSGMADSTTFLRGDSTWSSGTSTAHNLLSATHSDTTAGSVLRGDLIWGAAAGGWTRHAVGAANSLLSSDGTDPSWSVAPRVTRFGVGAAADAASALRIAGQYWSDEVAKGNSGTSMNIDWDGGVQQTVTLNNNVTFTFSNPHAGARYDLILTQDGTGSRLVTWPATVNWVGSAPTLSTGAGVTDLCTFAYSAVASGTYFGACNIGY